MRVEGGVPGQVGLGQVVYFGSQALSRPATPPTCSQGLRDWGRFGDLVLGGASRSHQKGRKGSQGAQGLTECL